MARVQLLLCFTCLLASVTLMEVVSAHLIKIKPSLPQIEDPKTVNNLTRLKVVMVFVSDLEKECPKTNKFKAFFDKLRAYAKKEESEESMKLIAEQQRERERDQRGILKWETVIARITNTMVQGTATNSSFSSGASFKDTTGSGSPSGSHTSSPSGSAGPTGSSSSGSQSSATTGRTRG
ncbi:LOW QUALITY PROTEIN: hypothetical protein HID58_049326 [Brassica napus]|uniref:DUF1216 domain-containing protein n=1 Tax=Brassica napus TaxID=3708 RepID=A0ABQ8B4Y2_BRANA|nr:LOW QUALITY PROTEIN: hypothetical protein HID58_049326 [Brassica napus]